MSSAYSIAQRTPLINGLFAGLACAIALTLTAGPALAQTADMERVEVRGRVVEAPVRYDVHASCNDLEGQLRGSLEKAWLRADHYGEVKVQFVVENGAVSAVQAKGISGRVASAVTYGVNRLDCSAQNTASAQLYRFSIDFIDPNARSRDTQTASAKHVGIRVAQLSR